MKDPIDYAQFAILGGNYDDGGGAYEVRCPTSGMLLRVIASWGEGWDHVSVSLPNRVPSWDEMCFIKRVFFGPDEVVMQLHPAEQNYVNCHPNCLHLWKPHQGEIPMPPTWMVGPKQMGLIRGAC